MNSFFKKREIYLFVVIAIAGFSLFGWIFGRIIFASIFPSFIPMAPLTSVLFLLLSLVLFYKFRSTEPGFKRSAGFSSLIFISLISIYTLLNRIFIFPWDVENLIVPNPETWMNVPTGRISPISALLFLFTCGGIFGVWLNKPIQVKYIGGALSLSVGLISFVILIGYLYNAPFLYGSHIIPVALPTAFCFTLLSINLLLSYKVRFWTLNLVNKNPVKSLLLKWFFPVVIIIVVLQGYLTTIFSIDHKNPTLAAALILLFVTIITIFVILKVSGILGTRIHNIETALRNSESRLQLLIQTFPDLVWMKDKEGTFLYCNRFFGRLLGAKEAEIIGKTDFDFYEQDIAKFFLKQDREVMEAGKPFRREEWRTFKEGGNRAYLEIIKTPVHDSIGNIIGVLGIGRDITSRKQEEEELIKAKEKAEESEKFKSAFIANMSHEIRTPMNGILGFAELLKNHNLSLEEKDEYINIIERSGERMLNIINDIISISKVEAGLMQLSVTETNVNDLVKYIYTFFKPEADKKGIKILYETALSENEALVETDKEKLYAVLTNLVKNAIKFTPKGSIELGYRKDGGCLEFFVKDTGRGIAEEQLGIIFERFRQVNESLTNNHEGSGLGLSISKAYVEMLGGKIWVESKFSEGSQFYFTLPYERGKDNGKSFPVEHSANKNGQQDVRLKILIAEDDKFSLLLLNKVLGQYAKEILTALDGTEAVETAKKNPDLDLIMMDIQMPEMDGFEAIKKIREFNKHVIIIAQTAFALPGDETKAMECGCNDYISKPINKLFLEQTIEKYFKRDFN